jgi:hypothetical protein
VAPATLFAAVIASPELSADVCRRVTKAALGFVNSSVVASLPSQLAHEVTQMTARITALGVAAALILTAGVGTGVGLVMAQDGGKTPDTKVFEKPKAEPPKPPSLETKPTADEIELQNQAKRRANRMENLAVYHEHMTQQIHEMEHQLVKAAADTGSEVDPKALQAKLENIDKRLLETEDRIAILQDATVVKAAKAELYFTRVKLSLRVREYHENQGFATEEDSVPPANSIHPAN